MASLAVVVCTLHFTKSCAKFPGCQKPQLIAHNFLHHRDGTLGAANLLSRAGRVIPGGVAERAFDLKARGDRVQLGIVMVQIVSV